MRRPDTGGGVTVNIQPTTRTTPSTSRPSVGPSPKAFVKGGDSVQRVRLFAVSRLGHEPRLAALNDVNPIVPAVSHTVFCVVPTPEEEEHHPDIHLEKSASLIAMPRGGPVTYTFVVTNTGTSR